MDHETGIFLNIRFQRPKVKEFLSLVKYNKYHNGSQMLDIPMKIHKMQNHMWFKNTFTTPLLLEEKNLI